MGTIFSGVGLISGIDIQSLVNQLMAIEARPRDLILQRAGRIDAQRTAFLDISARITALLGNVRSLTDRSFFEATRSTSSNPDALTAIAGAGTTPGSYNFIVRSLATSHQLVSRGFHARDVGLTPGTFTIESAKARTMKL